MLGKSSREWKMPFLSKYKTIARLRKQAEETPVVFKKHGGKWIEFLSAFESFSECFKNGKAVKVRHSSNEWAWAVDYDKAGRRIRVEHVAGKA